MKNVSKRISASFKMAEAKTVFSEKRIKIIENILKEQFEKKENILGIY